MGHRAMYVIRENGVNALYNSRWGALTVAEDVFWGPEKTEEFIRENASTDYWLDDVFGEGGIVLNKDRRTLCYSYCEWPDEDDIRSVYEELLAERWPGWQVIHAAVWGDLAECAEVSRDSGTAAPTPPKLFTVDELGTNLVKGWCCGFLSVKSEAGWSDHAVDFNLLGVLQNGPSLLTRVSDIAGIEQLRAAFANRRADDHAKSIGDWLLDLVAIDPMHRLIRIETDDYSGHVQFVEKVWEGWQVIRATGGPEAHFAYTDRQCPADFVPVLRTPEPDPPARSRSECERIIWQRLDGADKKKDDVQAMFRNAVSRIAADQGGPVTVAPGAMDRVPSVKPGFGARIAMFLRRIRSGAF